MSSANWEFVLFHMLDMVEEKLEIIHRLGRRFDNEFRQRIVKMTNLRLDLSFEKIALKQSDQCQIAVVDQNASIRNGEPANPHIGNSNLPSASLSVAVKAENANNSTEIMDSDVENGNDVDSQRASSQPIENGHANDIVNDEPNGANTNDEPTPTDASHSLAALPEMDVRIPDMDVRVQLHRLGSNQGNGIPESENGNISSTSSSPLMSQQRQTRQTCSSKVVQKKASFFQCKPCKFTTYCETTFKRHKRYHVCSKATGTVRDVDGLYHCTRCLQKFKQLADFHSHMSTTHGQSK